MIFEAIVFKGRLILCEPTDFPEGTVIRLQISNEPYPKRSDPFDPYSDLEGYYDGQDALKRHKDPGLISERYVRLPDGHINNCSLAFNDSNFPESTCQICDGNCPDRIKFKRKS